MLKVVRTGWALLLLVATAAHGVEVPIIGDAHVRGGSKLNTNYGSATALFVRRNTPRYTLLQFDTAGLSGNPVSATLSLRLLALQSPGTFDVYRVIAPWDEATVTGDTAPAYSASVIAGTLALTASDVGSVVTLDVLPAVEAWLSGEPNYGLILIDASAINAKFSSREGAVAPGLDVELVPIPRGSATVAKVGGDYTDPIEAMANVDSGDTWCGVPSADNPCILHIGPGIYDLDGETLEMRPFVSIQGAGSKATTLRSSAAVKVVVAASDTRLSSMRIEAGFGLIALHVLENDRVELADLDVFGVSFSLWVTRSTAVAIRDSSITIADDLGSSVTTYALAVHDSDVRVSGTRIEASGITGSIRSVHVSGASTVAIASSELIGSTLGAFQAKLICLASFNGDLDRLDTDCQL
ncbi:MAG: DNRLRE domain-containing protein [Pseudomonadota bacterium]